MSISAVDSLNTDVSQTKTDFSNIFTIWPYKLQIFDSLEHTGMNGTHNGKENDDNFYFTFFFPNRLWGWRECINPFHLGRK